MEVQDGFCKTSQPYKRRKGKFFTAKWKEAYGTPYAVVHVPRLGVGKYKRTLKIRKKGSESVKRYYQKQRKARKKKSDFAQRVSYIITDPFF